MMDKIQIKLSPSKLDQSSDINQKILKAVSLIEERLGEIKLNQLAQKLNISAFHFHRQFKKMIGVTPKQYAMHIRRITMQTELGNKTQTITSAIYEAGFNSGGRFYAMSNSILGMTPTMVRKGGDKVSILFALAETSLGALLVAKSGKGICKIALGDDANNLLQEFQQQFPNAQLEPNDDAFNKQIAMIVEMIESPSNIPCDLPLDIRGTAFQQKVWAILQKLNCGETISYKELAERIGQPTASRAVARACATNELALVIPCHRVVRQNGDLSGYRWGVERKRNLLLREQIHRTN